MFYIRGLIYEPIDAVDPANKELRTDLFSVSGLRAQYPQVFIRGRDGSCRFIGQYEEIQRLNERDELTYDWQDTFAKVNMFYDEEADANGNSAGGETNGYFVEGVEEEEELKEAAEKTPIRARIIPQDLEGEALSDAANTYKQRMQLLSSSKKKKHEYQMFPQESEQHQQQLQQQQQDLDNNVGSGESATAIIESAIKTLSSYSAGSTTNNTTSNITQNSDTLLSNNVQSEVAQQEAPLSAVKEDPLPPLPLPPPQWNALQTPTKGQILPPPPLPPPQLLAPPSLPPPPFPIVTEIANSNSSTPAPKESHSKSSTETAETSTPFLSPRSKARRRAGDWEQCTTSTGETYYFKRTTGESSWVDPRGAILESVLDSGNAVEDPIWLPMTDSKGRTYFYNRKTGKSSWKKV